MSACASGKVTGASSAPSAAPTASASTPPTTMPTASSTDFSGVSAPACAGAGACRSALRASGPRPAGPEAGLGLLRLFEHRLDVLPIDEMVEKGLEVFRAGVAIVDVVAVFPHIDAEDRRGAVHQGVLAIRGLGDLELAVLDGEPGPTRAELGYTRLHKIAAHFVEAAKVLVDHGLQLAGQFLAATTLLHPLPKVDVIVMLTDVVDNRGVLRRERFSANIFDAFPVIFGAGPRDFIAVIDVGLVVLVVVEFKRFFRHVRAERVVGIREFWELKRHGDTPLRLCGG